MRSDPTREDGYWRMWENATPSVGLFSPLAHGVCRYGGKVTQCLPALSASFSPSHFRSSAIRQKLKSCRCPTRFIEFGPFRASLTKIAGK